jgi:hypothetical protein
MAVGPGTLKQEDNAPRPMLEGMDEYYFADIHNPLSDDFVVQFASTMPTRSPVTIVPSRQGEKPWAEDELKNRAGVDLRNPHNPIQGRQHLISTRMIKSGETVRLLGLEAQKACKQIVDEIMQRDGQALMLGNLFARHAVEQQVVKNTGNVRDEYSRPTNEPFPAANPVIEKTANEFPEVTQNPEPVKRGRPAKQDSNA